MKDVFFKDWQSIGYVAMTTVIGFITLFLFVRISGKRTLAKLNAFDFVVTIALGSTLSYMMLALVPLIEGVVVLFLIIIMQYVFALSARSSVKMEKFINTVPQIVFYNGKFQEKVLSSETITKDEVYAAIRNAGIDQMDEVKAVVMELNGTMTVIKKSGENGQSSLDNLETGE
ncbi:DUF421 domain-containing protein [Flavobacterium sp.]|uniref:DUF421 domain-containing protein n=1 Tax=Flavobacterium sp. TaxID=239 RepID=UPI002C365FAE|nr:YetF domain-containing protein [Flavobacterium sp.]HSD07991.1 YetF domain-containing protein [Flavobacterium sp.]